MELSEKKLKELKKRKISIEDLNEKYLYTKKDGVNTDNTLLLLNENIVPFQELVDKFNSDSRLYELLGSKEFFEELMQSNKLNTEDLRYLLNRIKNWSELSQLCWNTSLIKHILNEFVLNKEIVDRLNTMLENDKFYKELVATLSWYKDENIYTVFDIIEDHNKNTKDKEVLKLNELNEKICMLNNFDLIDEQKLEIHEILRNNEVARNRLIQIMDNNLENQYSFETLKNLLTKDSKKRKIKLNI